ncbi:MAG: uracil-DNA glycosylase [Candidatus Schekmanbacteria bacterium]|nr:uracil-DNA glycosylase [Candidatus Schekmanbacteria bacterium]
MSDKIKNATDDLISFLEYQKSLGVKNLLSTTRNTEMKKNTGTELSKNERITHLKEYIGDCKRCRLCEERKTIVFGAGDYNARLMFVGEAPGRDEDIQGKPFVGRAGKLLTDMINAMGLSREQVFIANIIKCRPPQNRNPMQDEIEQCEPFLVEQINIIQPEVIVALGTFSAQTLLKTENKISNLRGRFDYYRDIKLMPTYHPAYLLRNPNEKKNAWDDLKCVLSELGLAVPSTGTRKQKK